VRRYTITQDVYAHFLGAFEDNSRIHVDEAYARARGFKGRVMHGAILSGFVSHFVGVHFGGDRALLLTLELRYAHANYLDDVVEIRSTVLQRVDSMRVVVLDLRINNVTRGELAASGRAQVRLDNS